MTSQLANGRSVNENWFVLIKSELSAPCSDNRIIMRHYLHLVTYNLNENIRKLQKAVSLWHLPCPVWLFTNRLSHSNSSPTLSKQRCFTGVIFFLLHGTCTKFGHSYNYIATVIYFWCFDVHDTVVFIVLSNWTVGTATTINTLFIFFEEDAFWEILQSKNWEIRLRVKKFSFN